VPYLEPNFPRLNSFFDFFRSAMGISSSKPPSTSQSPRFRSGSTSSRDLSQLVLPTSTSVFAPSKRTETSIVVPLLPSTDPRETSVVYLQSMIRRWNVEQMFERALRRKAVANELFETEINYVANLKVLIDVFANPLSDSCDMASKASDSCGSVMAIQPIITESQIRTLFSSAEVLLQFQEVFLNNLKSKIDQWHYDQTIGEILTLMTPFMRLYAEYVGNFSEATELYQKLVSKKGGNARFKAFLECAYQSPSIMSVGELDSFLVQPVQRLPRYKMFLEQLIKLTPAGHEDLIPLQIALKKVGDVVKYVNEKKRSHDLELQVFIAYGKIEPPVEDLVAPGRALLLEGPLYWTKSLKETRILCHGFLFSDIMIVAKVPSDPQGKRFKFLARFDLRTLNIGEILHHHPTLIATTTSLTSSSSSLSTISPDQQSKTESKPSDPHHTSTEKVKGSSSSNNSMPVHMKTHSSSGDFTASSRMALSREPCYYLMEKFAGQLCAWCWQDEKEALKWKEALTKAAGKVHLARETNPTTSEGKAQAFKSTVSRHYVTASGSIIPIHSPQPSQDAGDKSESERPKSPSSHMKTQSLPAPSTSTSTSSTTTTTDAPKPQRQLRKFAERRRELGI
jgi:hypothetical protein